MAESYSSEVNQLKEDIKALNAKILKLQAHLANRRQLDEVCHAGLLSLNESGICLEIDNQCLDLLGYRSKDVIGQDICRFLQTEWQSPFKEALQILFSEGNPINLEVVFQKRTGDSFTATFTAIVPSCSADGSKSVRCRIQALSRTENEMTHQVSGGDASQFGIFIEQAPVAIAMFDMNMCYLSASRRWREDYGLGKRQLIGLSHYHVFPEIPDRWKEIHRRGLRGEILRAEADLFLRADGSKQWVRWEIRPWTGNTGEIGGILIFAEDITDLTKTKEALGCYELLARGNRDIILFVRLSDGRILEANNAASLNYGYTRDELLRMNITELRAAETQVLTKAQMSEADAKGFLFETIHQRKNGSTFPVEVNAQGTVMDETRVLLSVVRDISQRKQSEDKIYKETELRRLALNASNQGAWDYNIENAEFYWDAQCRSLWGIKDEAQISYALAVSRIHPEDRETTDKVMKQAIAGVNDGIYQCQFRVLWPDGSRHWIESHGRVYTKEVEGVRKPARIVGVNREITEKRIAEVRMAWLASIVESTEDAIIAKDLHGTISSWNTGATKLFGYSPEEVVGKPITILIPEEMHDEEAGILQRLSAGELIKSFETIRLTKEGRKLEVSLTVSPIRDNRGQIIGISKIARDITERKNAARALQQAIDEIQTLRGIVPICASCKKIRDDKGFWYQVESYVQKHTLATFSHGICPECCKKLYPEFYDENMGGLHVGEKPMK